MSKEIITADWHISKRVPPARAYMTEDEWEAFQKNQVRAVFEYAVSHGYPVKVLGDIFDFSQIYYGVVGWLNALIEEYQSKGLELYKLAGNHDLPYNTMDNVLASAWNVTRGTDLTSVCPGAFHYTSDTTFSNKEEIVYTHQLVFPDEKSRPYGAIGKTAEELVFQFKNALYIFTGDYHKHFAVETEEECMVINPGCLIRRSADDQNYIPGFYVVDTDNDFIEFVELEDTDTLITAHLEKQKVRNERITAFIEQVQKTGKVTLSYTDNLHKKLKLKSVNQLVRDVITEIEMNIGVNK